jgi:hypothetical protein
MSRIRWVLLGVALTLPGGCSSDQAATGGKPEPLDGSWVVTSVQREGKPDPLQVGAKVTFLGNQVTFQPKVAHFVDGAS